MMTTAITSREFDLIRTFIAKETGISLAEDKVYLVETRLREIMRDEGLADFSALHEALQSPLKKTLRERVLDAMTTNETLWFRDKLPFEVFQDHLLPAYAAEIRQGQRRKIRIWSAACSTGQEPYSLAMCFLEAARRLPELNLGQLEILATDYSDKALARAREGFYGSMAMSRGLPPGFQEKYFTLVDGQFRVSRELQERIVFQKFNLQDSFAMMGTFDIILTRYVLIYFDDDFKREVLGKAHGALAQGGVLFLGSSESLPEGTTGYSLVRAGRATYYRRSGQGNRAASGNDGFKLSGGTERAAGAPSLPPAKETVSNNNTANLEKATADLATIVKRLQELNARHQK
jgi:chemotaxis protein methyltransferase CheR